MELDRLTPQQHTYMQHQNIMWNLGYNEQAQNYMSSIWIYNTSHQYIIFAEQTLVDKCDMVYVLLRSDSVFCASRKAHGTCSIIFTMKKKEQQWKILEEKCV